MTPEQIANALGGATKTGDGFKARCPVHDDSTASLSIGYGKDGTTIVVHCFAGCEQRDVIEKLKSRHLWPNGLDKRPWIKREEHKQREAAKEPPATWIATLPDDPEPKAPAEHPTLGEPHAHWIYHDKDGKPSFAVCRFNKPDGSKEFRPLTRWRLDETGEFKWRWKAPPAPRPLFNLHELTASTKAALIVEGEKCSTAAMTIFPEMVSTTSMNGADGASKTDWSPLAGREIILWQDLGEDGAKYVDDVAVILSKLPGTTIFKIDALALARIDPKGGTREPPAKFDAAFAIGKGKGEDSWPLEALRTAALGLVQPVDLAVVAEATRRRETGVKDSNIIDLATVRARVEAAGSDAAETLVELIRQVPPEDRDAIGMAKIVQFAAKKSKIGTKVIKDPIARDANESGPHKSEGSPPSEEDDGRPIIKLKPGEEPRIVDEIEAAILLADQGLYQRGGLIVRVEDRKFLGFEEKEVVATAIAEQCEHTLLEDAAAAAHFLKYNERAKGWVSASPPMLHINIWRGRGGRSRLPILSGPIGSPLILPTGRIIEKPGFDAATGFFFNPLGIDFSPVPRNPTRQDALDAIDLLDQLLVDFPFAEDGGVSRSVALAGLLTAVMRRAVGLAPMFAITAPSFGSGKSYLVNVFCALSTGRAAPVVTPGKTEKEFETRLDALLLEGVNFIAIDNVEPSQLGVQALATTLSEREKKCRVLSESKMPVCSTDVFISCTGNNLEIVEDLRRRTLLCSLDPKEERPWTRRFEADPVSMLSRERGRFVIACLTIVRAYMVSGEKAKIINEKTGEPEDFPPYANYEVWSQMIREPLLWLGLADPVASQAATEELDPFRDKLLAVAMEWEALFGDDLKTCPEIRSKAEDKYSVSDGEPPKLINRGFHDALLAVAEKGGKIDGDRLVKWLGRARGQRINGYRFEMITNSISNAKKTRNKYWRLNGAAPCS
jgi:hypothetical protein